MSKTTDSTAKASAPTHIAYQVKEHGKQGYKTSIGAAWANKNDKGFNIQLDCLPLDGRIKLHIAANEA